jgi:ribosomal-protein-alanine N-acetyltransferase
MIRPFQPLDTQKVLGLFDQNCPQYFDASEKEGLLHYLQSEREDYFVLEENGVLLGCGGINYEYDKQTAIISWDIVDGNHHGKGLGKQLLQFRINHINSNTAIRSILVRTSQHTHKFYEKLGFKLEEVIKDYWAKGFDLYQMRMPNLG